MYKAEDFFEDIKPRQSNNFKFGTITEFTPGQRPLVKLDGENEGKNIGIPYLESYTPSEGDRVILANYNGYVILGKII